MSNAKKQVMNAVAIHEASCRGLLDTAVRDAEAARLLYAAGFYPQAVFLLQQAVEKSVKSAGLALGIVSLTATKSEVAHSPIKIYHKAARKLLGLVKGQDVPIKTAQLLIALVGKLDKEQHTYSHGVQPTRESLKHWLTQSEALRVEYYEEVQGKGGEELAQIIEVEASMVPAKAAQFAGLFYEGLIALVLYYDLCRATHGHSETTRYGRSTQTPTQIYDGRHPVVEYFPELMEHLRFGLDLMCKLAAMDEPPDDPAPCRRPPKLSLRVPLRH